MNKVYRFHGPADDTIESCPIRLRKNRWRTDHLDYLIAADHRTITDADGTRPINAYQDTPFRFAATLTRREAEIIAVANPGARPPAAMEDIYPWLPKRAFVPNSAIGYHALSRLHQRYEPHLKTAAAFCDEKWNTICNSVRRKTVFDRRFYTAWHMPIQQVFLLEENRSNRSVIAIDVNAMYSACMQAPMPKPSGLQRVELNREHRQGEKLVVGLYRCRLSSPKTNFIRVHNPFRTLFCGRRLQPNLDEPLEVDLNEFEIDYYQRHFRRIYLVDAVIAEEVIAHPLAREARRSFSRRQSFRSQANEALAAREKFLATLLSSCASRTGRTSHSFDDRPAAMHFLSRTLGVAPPADEPDAATDHWLIRRARVTISSRAKGVSVDVPDLDDGSCCFMFGQRIVAMGRVRILELMERVLCIGPETQICYVNIDSIHFSVPTENREAAISELRAEASDAMGSFKIESVTAHGLWLEPGRYWLYSNRIEKFRNRGIGDQDRPFKDRAVYVANRRIGQLHIPIKTVLRMDRTMSDVRALVISEATTVVRQKLIEIDKTSTFSGTLDMLEENRRTATHHRLNAFKGLKWRLEIPCPAASGQG